MAEVVWTEKALARLREISDYIAEKNPAAAEKIVEGISVRVDQLEAHPESGYRYEESLMPIRILVYGNSIAYVVEGRERVSILGVFHGAMDLKRHLD